MPYNSLNDIKPIRENMNKDTASLNKEERVALTLRGVYESLGYRKYKMSRFEEYAFYLNYKSFLPFDRIITFTDIDGKLMALKPDVTLSIVKNAKEYKGGFEKLYYIENVYKPDKNSRKFKEISQIGLEALGEIDGYTTFEVISLALRSLEAIEDDFVLDISHIGIVMGLFDCGELKGKECKDKIIECIVSKNPHDLAKILAELGVSAETSERFKKLITITGNLGEALAEIRGIVINEEMQKACEELEGVWRSLKGSPYESKVKIDFSIINDINYYCGIIFQGYVRRVPRMVLSGGRYDKLLKELGKDVGAIGFALVTDELNGYYGDSDVLDADAVVIYQKGADPKALFNAIESLTEKGIKVRAETSKPDNLRYGKLYKFEGGKLEEYDV